MNQNSNSSNDEVSKEGGNICTHLLYMTFDLNNLMP